MRIAVAVVLAALALAATVFADDSAAAISAGGLVPRRETRIVMAKEVPRIGMKKIVVDYDFRKDSDQDVTTEVAFPVPHMSMMRLMGTSPNSRFLTSSFLSMANLHSSRPK